MRTKRKSTTITAKKQETVTVDSFTVFDESTESNVITKLSERTNSKLLNGIVMKATILPILGKIFSRNKFSPESPLGTLINLIFGKYLNREIQNLNICPFGLNFN